MKRIEEISWIDAVGADGWVTSDELEKTTLSPMTTVGYVFKETKDFILLTMTWDAEYDNYGAFMCIPKSTIVKRRKL